MQSTKDKGSSPSGLLFDLSWTDGARVMWIGSKGKIGGIYEQISEDAA